VSLEKRPCGVKGRSEFARDGDPSKEEGDPRFCHGVVGEVVEVESEELLFSGVDARVCRGLPDGVVEGSCGLFEVIEASEVGGRECRGSRATFWASLQERQRALLGKP
jgi:hypothetical protein